MSVKADPLRARGSDVAALIDTLRRGGSALESVPHQIKQILRDETWRHFVTRLGKEVRHEWFAYFVTTPPLRGLGTSPSLVERVIEHDPEALQMFRQAMKGTNNISTKSRTTRHGTRRDYALERLERDAPELHAEVLAGRLSAHAAMVKAGFRPRTFSVRPEPKSAARTLRKYMTADQLAELVRLLTQEGDI